MKKFKILFFISVAFYTLLLFSCSKDEIITPGNPGEGDASLLLKKWVTEKYTIEYSYNSDNSLKTYRLDYETETNSFIDEHVYFYDSDTSGFEEVLFFEDDTTYSTWKYIRLDDANYIQDVDGNTTLYASSIESICGYMQVNIYKADTLYRVDNYEYIDDNCSYILTSSPDYGYEKIEKAFDGKNSSYRGYMPEFYSEPNGNPTQVIYYDFDGSIFNSISFNAEYEYNELEYPISMTITYLDGNVKVQTYEYY